MVSLNSILDVVVPLGIFIFVIFIFASPFKRQLRDFWNWLTEKLTGETGEKVTIDPSIPQTIVYER